MEDDLNFCLKEDDLKKIRQSKTIKSKNNGCGTAPGNLVITHYQSSSLRLPKAHYHGQFHYIRAIVCTGHSTSVKCNLKTNKI